MPSPVLTRQKLLLELINKLGGKCEKLFLMKAMFLLCTEEIKEPAYDFYPYKWGAFSRILYNDLRVLEKKGYVKQSRNNTVCLERKEAKAKPNNEEIIKGLNNVVNRCGSYTSNGLLRKTYKEYPYYAIRNPNCKGRYNFADPKFNPNMQNPVIFTIGYEGTSIDMFLNKLIKNNIHILCDIRNNPRSMKYGFTWPRIRDLCEASEIEYEGLPQLGIRSESRQNLKTKKDYKRLFAQYDREVLPKANSQIKNLKNMLDEKKRIALMCFEKDEECCHRSRTASHLSNYCKNNYEVIHI